MDKTEPEADELCKFKGISKEHKKNNNFQNNRIRKERFLIILFYSGLPTKISLINSKFQSHGTGLYLFL